MFERVQFILVGLNNDYTIGCWLVVRTFCNIFFPFIYLFPSKNNNQQSCCVGVHFCGIYQRQLFISYKLMWGCTVCSANLFAVLIVFVIIVVCTNA